MKNKDFEKALKRANREIEKEIYGPGFKRNHSVHTSKKTYKRSRDKKVDLDSYFLPSKNRSNSL